MQRVSAETPREDSDRSVCATHCEQWLQLREQKTLTETSQEVSRSADACLSFARVASKLCVVVNWSGCVQQGTGVQLFTVEQECLLLGTDVKHYEVQNLFSPPNAPPPSALFKSVAWIAEFVSHRRPYRRFSQFFSTTVPNPSSYCPIICSVSVDPRLLHGSRMHSDFTRRCSVYQCHSCQGS